jgi:hypothetical protein
MQQNDMCDKFNISSSTEYFRKFTAQLYRIALLAPNYYVTPENSITIKYC